MTHFPDSGVPVSLEHLVGSRVVDAAGNEARIVSIQPENEDGASGAQAWIRLNEGVQVLVPVSLLAMQQDKVCRLPFVIQLPQDSQQAAQMRFPVMEEKLHVDKRVIDTGRGVRIHKTVTEREQVVDVPLLHDRLDIKFIPVGRMLTEESDVPQMRYEGDTLVVPVLEEVLVVQKRVLLKEEVRITRRQEEVHKPETVMLRAEHVQVERFEEGRH